MATPKVNSELLAQALESAGPKITGFTSTLDGISADIRAIERWLLESGVRFEISEVVGKEIDPSGCGYIRYLVWYGGKDGKSWRIYYRDTWGIPGEEVDRHGELFQLTIRVSSDERPLIETPVAIRLQSVDPLARLVSAIASRIPERFSVFPRQLLLFN